MSTSAGTNVTVQPGIESRVLTEGYGPGAWHGPDLKAALSDVTSGLAFWRPQPERHNIAEIAVHHAYYARAVRLQLSGQPGEPFVLTGEDWFDVNDDRTLPWPTVLATLDSEQRRLGALVAEIEAGKVISPLTRADRLNLVLGITCHAVYHAGQIQLIKRLRGE
jgi:hypothetical protein